MLTDTWIDVKGYSPFCEETFRGEGDAGSHVTSQLATDLSARQVNARITPRVHIAVSVSISMIKHREVERDWERKRGKNRDGNGEWPHWRPVAEISCPSMREVSAARKITLIHFSAAQDDTAAMHQEIPQLPSFSLLSLFILMGWQHHPHPSCPPPCVLSLQSPHPLSLVIR